ncbi:MAG: ABC transporter permease [Bacteroidales bacterium]|nr:ABC transporter permease [Bacteroidales bacterium]
MSNFIPKGQGALIKILSLAIGLTVGLVLIAKVQLERNFDRCVEGKEHVYEINETYQRQGQEVAEHGATSGGIVPKLCQYVPEIIVGTRYTGQFYHEKLMSEDGQRYGFENSIFADSCFFDIFGTRILVGEAKQLLTKPGHCLISRSLSEKLGGDVVGRTFTYMAAPGKPMTISGIFEDFDENSSFNQLDIVMSMSSIGTYTWDGTSNMFGNDRYHSFVRLTPNADLQKIQDEVKVMIKEVYPWDELREAGYVDLGFKLYPLSERRMSNTTVRTTCIILFIVALVMLFTAVMNYILVVISSLVGKARLVALRKVLGAPKLEFYVKTLGEAFVHLLLALLIMALLLWAGKDWIRDLMGISVSTLFSTQTYLILAVVCLVVLICCGLLPGYIYSCIPLVYAYRLFSESKRVWKLSLLAFQLCLSTMLLCILSTIYRQYDYMMNKDLGYEYENVAFIHITHPSDSTAVLAREIEKLPCIESTSTAYSLFLQWQSGNNIMLPDDTRELFNYACMYFAEPGIVETMGLTIVQGMGFTPLEQKRFIPEVIVNEKFAQMLKEFTGWDDVIGRSVLTTEIGPEYPLTIVGIVKDFTLGTLVSIDERPTMFMNGSLFANYVLLKFNDLTPDNITSVQQLCDRLYPDAEFQVKPYAGELADSYQQTQHTRDLILIGCLAALLITLIGLIGYIRDEVQRRTRELAIRKVMGASIGELQALFLRNIAIIALPSIIVGIILGWYFSQLLMDQFADKVALHGWIFVIDALVVILIIAIVVFFQTRRICKRNPVENIKIE